MQQILEKSELTGKRAFIKRFIKKIKVIGRQGIINYFLPINGVLEERMGVLPIVQCGGRCRTIGRTFSLSFSLANNQDKSSTLKKQGRLIEPQTLLRSSSF
jgi:hypothetical protein